MSPAEWIALVGLALTVALASVASWRASLRRDGTIDERMAQLRKDLDHHADQTTKRLDAHDARFDEGRERRHELRTQVQQLYGEIKEELAELRGRQR